MMYVIVTKSEGTAKPTTQTTLDNYAKEIQINDEHPIIYNSIHL